MRCVILTHARRTSSSRNNHPNGLHFTINHGGIPSIDPDKHKLVIHGLVKRPLEFTLETLSRYPHDNARGVRRMRWQ